MTANANRRTVRMGAEREVEIPSGERTLRGMRTVPQVAAATSLPQRSRRHSGRDTPLSRTRHVGGGGSSRKGLVPAVSRPSERSCRDARAMNG